MLLCVFIAEALTPQPFIIVEDLEATSRSVFIGENITIVANAKNIGRAIGESQLHCYLDGISIFSKNLTLKPGESRELIFCVRVSSEGNHALMVGDKTITVEAHPLYFEGAYLIYNVYGTHQDRSFQGTTQMDFSNVTDHDYDVLTTTSGVPGQSQYLTTMNYSIPATSNILRNNMIVGKEYIITPFGWKMAEHAYISNLTTRIDAFYVEDTDIMYKMMLDQPSIFIVMELKETNMSWMKS